MPTLRSTGAIKVIFGLKALLQLEVLSDLIRTSSCRRFFKVPWMRYWIGGSVHSSSGDSIFISSVLVPLVVVLGTESKVGNAHPTVYQYLNEALQISASPKGFDPGGVNPALSA